MFSPVLRRASCIASIYVDDCALIGASKELAEESARCMETLSTVLGFALSSKKAAMQSSAPTEENPKGTPVRLLGVDLVPDYENNTMRIVVPRDKIEKLEEQIDAGIEQLQNKSLRVSEKTFQKICGIANFAFCCGASGEGAAMLHPLYPLTDFGKKEKDREKREKIKKRFLGEVNSEQKRRKKITVLRYIREFIQDLRPRSFHANKEIEQVVAMWTDASGDGGLGKNPAISACLVDETGAWHIMSATIEMSSTDELRRIAVSEMLAILVAATTFETILEGKRNVEEPEVKIPIYGMVKTLS